MSRKRKNLNPSHILISRTNNIGDIVLSIPAIDKIKHHYPNVQITLLAREYTRDIIALFPNIDHIILRESLLQNGRDEAIAQLKQGSYDAFISMDNNLEMLKLAKAAAIPLRIATARRWQHWFYSNCLLNHSRKKSNLHEAQLNLQLAEPFGINTPNELSSLYPKAIEIQLPLSGIAALDEPDDRFKLILHPASNKNGREWPEDYFIELINQLNPKHYKIFITGSEQEKERLSKLCSLHHEHLHNIMGQMSLKQWAHALHIVDGMIAAGTGPLHLSAALKTRTLGLFPRKKPTSIERWGPLGPKAEYLMQPGDCEIKQCSNNACPCMQAIHVDAVMAVIQRWRNSI